MTSTTAGWEAPDDYTFSLRSRCGEGDDLGRYEIVAEGGEVVDVETFTQSAGPPVPLGFSSGYDGDAPTLEDVVHEAAHAESAGADVVELTVDPVDGRPTRLDIDWNEEAIDDEFCLYVLDYRPG